MTIAIKNIIKIWKKNIRYLKDLSQMILIWLMVLKGYKLINVVPRFFSDGRCAGYTYWFIDISEIK